jgi:hypothetical protein
MGGYRMKKPYLLKSSKSPLVEKTGAGGLVPALKGSWRVSFPFMLKRGAV